MYKHKGLKLWAENLLIYGNNSILPPIDDNSDSPLYLHIDCAHMGVGGDNSWSPVTLDEYFIPPEEEWEYSITIRPMKVSV